MPHPLPPKKEVALALLERSSVHLHLDPRGAGVIVPPWFKKQAQLVLKIELAGPTPDLKLDDRGVSCTLGFKRELGIDSFFCVVPWPSVFALVGDDGSGMIWPDDVPAEVQSQGPGVPRGEGCREPARRPQLEAVKNVGSAAKRARKKPQLVRMNLKGGTDGRVPVLVPL